MAGLYTYRSCYIGMPLYICGFVVLGAAFEKHLSVGAVVMGWGMSLCALIVITVSICEFLHPCLICENLMIFLPRCVRQ
jgi:Flp pilus assembly protein protease CpaA